MRITYLNLTDLDRLIHEYEEKYGVSSVSMLKDAEVRSKISEDELLKWEAYITQRLALREYHQQIHRGYLPGKGRSTKDSVKKEKSANDDPFSYAA
jgi:hypothetical protein